MHPKQTSRAVDACSLPSQRYVHSRPVCLTLPACCSSSVCYQLFFSVACIQTTLNAMCVQLICSLVSRGICRGMDPPFILYQGHCSPPYLRWHTMQYFATMEYLCLELYRLQLVHPQQLCCAMKILFFTNRPLSTQPVGSSHNACKSPLTSCRVLFSDRLLPTPASRLHGKHMLG